MSDPKRFLSMMLLIVRLIRLTTKNAVLYLNLTTVAKAEFEDVSSLSNMMSMRTSKKRVSAVGSSSTTS